nr:hypothetical protein [Tanacetum cinerariifolium]
MQSIKSVNTTCETYGGPHSYTECLVIDGYTQEAAYATTVPIPEPEVAPKPNPKPLIPYPSRLNDQKLIEKDNNQLLKFLQIFQILHFDISFMDALLYMLKFGSTFKSLLKLEECLALADLGASINLMPLSVWKKLSLPELTPTRMTLKIANRSVAYLVGVAEDVFVKVRKFYFSADFVVVDYDVDPRVPLILGRPFLRMTQALIDESVNRIDVLDVSYEEYAQEVLGFSDSSTSGNLTPSNPIIASSSPSLKQVDVTMSKPSIEEPLKLELKDLPSHLDYVFLEGTDKLPVIISKELKDEENAALLEVLKSHKWAITWKISDIKGKDTRFYTHKILMEDDFKPVLNDATRKDHFSLPFMDQMLERLEGNEYYCFLDGFSRYFQFPINRKAKRRPPPLAVMVYLPTDACLLVYVMIRARSKDKMLKGCEDTNLVLNWDKCHFMVKEGIVLDHKFSKSGIEVDRAKVDVIAKLLHPTSVKGPKNLTADHLSRLENPHEGDFKKKEINKTFPLETLGMISIHDDVFTAKKPLISSRLAIMDPPGDIMMRTTLLRKSLILDSIGRRLIAKPMTWLSHVTHVNIKEKSRKKTKCLKMQFKYARPLTYEALTLWVCSRLLEGTNTFLWPLTTCLNGSKRKRSPLMMPEVS